LFNVGPDFHVILAFGIIILWPLTLIGMFPTMALVIFALNLVIFVVTWIYCACKECGYFDGMEIIATPLLSGWANITMLYLPFFLAITHYRAVLYAYRGIRNGKEEAELNWINFVHPYLMMDQHRRIH
jgi:hypothetical protein